MLPHAGQLYKYRTAQSAMGGGELEMQWQPDIHYRLEANAAFLYQHNLTDGYPLPMCPPARLQGEGEYRMHGIPERFGALYIAALPSYTFPQRATARNEQPTDGYALLSATLRYTLKIRASQMDLSLLCSNIFDKRYFNHLSFYRTLNIPEEGRSFKLSLSFSL